MFSPRQFFQDKMLGRLYVRTSSDWWLSSRGVLKKHIPIKGAFTTDTSQLAEIEPLVWFRDFWREMGGVGEDFAIQYDGIEELKDWLPRVCAAGWGEFVAARTEAELSGIPEKFSFLPGIVEHASFFHGHPGWENYHELKYRFPELKLTLPDKSKILRRKSAMMAFVPEEWMLWKTLELLRRTENYGRLLEGKICHGRHAGALHRLVLRYGLEKVLAAAF